MCPQTTTNPTPTNHDPVAAGSPPLLLPSSPLEAKYHTSFKDCLGLTGGRRGEAGGVEDNVMACQGRATVDPIIVFPVENGGIPGAPSVLDGFGLISLPLDLQASPRSTECKMSRYFTEMACV